mmetsp:Transcript_12226/g.25767  ORF Transcript_12226/g.25767 Transcript_12226/m.25767 type:complete len:102 (+) Transcript_12226:1339-1644(+)
MARVVNVLACKPTLPDIALTMGSNAMSDVYFVRPIKPHNRSLPPEIKKRVGISKTRVTTSATMRSGKALLNTEHPRYASASFDMDTLVAVLSDRISLKTLS